MLLHTHASVYDTQNSFITHVDIDDLDTFLALHF